MTDTTLLIDGTIDGLTPGLHGLHVHEFGDFTEGCVSTGGHYNPTGRTHGGPEDSERHAGDLGNVLADASGRAQFLLSDAVLKVRVCASLVASSLTPCRREGLGADWTRIGGARGRGRSWAWRARVVAGDGQRRQTFRLRSPGTVGGRAAKHKASLRLRRRHALGRQSSGIVSRDG